jgi:F-type H+-transporting ATPase subunit b
MIVFALLVWFTMKFVWPPITKAMEERQKKIADGLASADRGRHELDLAQKRASELIKEARVKANEILEQANKRGNEIVEEAKVTARQEGERLIGAAHAQIEQERSHARSELQKQLVTLAVAGAGKILEREVDAKAHHAMLEELAQQL